jgi:Domain of unknown function (DUF5671)
MENQAPTGEKASAKHVFLHLFVIVMLYYSTVNFLILLFQYVNYWVPDKLAATAYYQMMYSTDLIRFAIASLIIVFPVFIITSRYMNKSYQQSAAIREMKTRKWLTYFTLFAAALIIIGDLVRTILTLLEGEITLRFILKAASILLVTGIIFYYYLRDLKQEKLFIDKKIFVWIIIAMVGVTVVAGFFIIGSPKSERLRRFDYQRVMSLQEIQMQVINYWRSKEVLPVRLEDTEDKISGFVQPTDPETGVKYEYTVKGPETFELCATFGSNSADDKVLQQGMMASPISRNEAESWKHGVGRTCFERTIDKELYPPYSKQIQVQPIK